MTSNPFASVTNAAPMDETTGGKATVKRTRRQRTARERWIALGLGGGFILLILVVWQVLASTAIINSFLFSSPVGMVSRLWANLISGELSDGLLVSLEEFVIGFAIALVGGAVIGVVMGRFKWVERLVDPLVWIAYAAPLLALYPLFVLVFGLGEPSVIAITVVLSIVPIIANVALGLRNTDPKLVKAARSFGAGERAMLVKVVLPASIPTLMAGVRLGLGRALVGVVIGEFFAGNAGIGYNISFFAGRLRADDLMSSILVVLIVGVLLNMGARRLERLSDFWRSDSV